MNSKTLILPGLKKNILSGPSLWRRRFWIRMRSWEYWPIYIFNIPVVMIWLWHALKSQSLFFFTMTNPGIPTGGFFGESKFKILELIPDVYKAKTVLIDASIRGHEIDAFIQRSGLTFPLIVKPE